MGTERLPILPPRYGDPFYRGRGRAEEEVEEEENGWVKDHLKEKQTEGLEEVLPIEMEEEMEEDFILRPLQREIREIGMEEEWSIPASDGRRGRDIPVSSPTIQGLQHRTPPTPAPSEDRFFMDWSSIGMGSPLVRTPPQSISVRERGQEINQPTIQTSQPGSEPTQMGVTENALQEDPIVTTPTT